MQSKSKYQKVVETNCKLFINKNNIATKIRYLKEDIAKVKYEFEKDASEFESIKEIIDFLKSDDDIYMHLNCIFKS